WRQRAGYRPALLRLHRRRAARPRHVRRFAARADARRRLGADQTVVELSSRPAPWLRFRSDRLARAKTRPTSALLPHALSSRGVIGFRAFPNQAGALRWLIRFHRCRMLTTPWNRTSMRGRWKFIIRSTI